MPITKYKAVEDSVAVPKEVQRVIDAINEGVREETTELIFDLDESDLFQLLVFDEPEDGWLIGPNVEGYAFHSTVFYDGQWHYRRASDGKDALVPDGEKEVIANWICYFTG